MKGRRLTGQLGEQAAASYLERQGFRILERNWRCRSGEIDLIAFDDETLVFVEVRSRTNPTRFGTAVEAVDYRKIKQVRDVAAVYLKLNAAYGRQMRFDVVAVTFQTDGNIAELKHIQGAF